MRVQKLLICTFAFVLANCAGAKEEPQNVEVGSRVPAFSLKTLDGTTVSNDSLQGNAFVLNFWATWCAPCMEEIPDLKEVSDRGGAIVIGIALDEDGAKAVKPFVQKHGINYTVLLGDQELFERFNGMGIPYTLLLDSSQHIAKIYRGPTTRESLERDLKMINQTAQLR